MKNTVRIILRKNPFGYFTERPEEIEGFLSVLFEEYAEDKDSAALLADLRIIARVKR
jgi:hypothetical protein